MKRVLYELTGWFSLWGAVKKVHSDWFDDLQIEAFMIVMEKNLMAVLGNNMSLNMLI